MEMEKVFLARKKPASTEQAHRFFDMIWQKNHMSREEAYAWLATRLGVEEPEAHMRGMPHEQCLNVVHWSIQLLNDMRRLDMDFGADPPHPFFEIQ